ncbi:copper resistance protein B [Sphingosinicellaceae bacterium]|nr:copper resistance protein B [Sphingosinicellaceae bacterium]
MKSLLVVTVAATMLGLSSAAMAQDHSMDGMQMPGMNMPMAKTATPKKAGSRKPTLVQPPQGANSMGQTKPTPAAAPSVQMRGMASETGATPSPQSDQVMPGMQMQGETDQKQMGAMPDMQMSGTALSAGTAPPPPLPSDHYADRFFPSTVMTDARDGMMHEQGGQKFYQVMFNLAELQIRHGKDGYRWDGEAWFGGDINRVTLKSEGSGAFREGVDSAEVQALFSRAVGPYFNLQAGVRHDFQPSPTRTYATAGFEGLAPYMFQLSGAAFLSEKGDLLGRLEGYYDQRITQRLILQPRAELNFAAQDVPENRYGAGLVNAELGLRLRYEIAREFAPYIGVSYEAKTGRSADFARADGQSSTTTSFVAGIHFWF